MNNLEEKNNFKKEQDISIEDIISNLISPELSTQKKWNQYYELGFSKNPELINEIIKNLDFINKENFFKTGVLIDFLSSFLSGIKNEGDNFIFNKIGIDIINILKYKKQENNGSYLLQQRLSQVINKMGVVETLDITPILKINSQYYGCVINNVFYICDDPIKNKEIKNLLDEINKLHEEFINNKNKISIKSFLPFTRDVIDLKKTRVQKVKDIFLKNNKKLNDIISENLSKEDIYDFGFICKKSIREKINQDLSINQENLSLKEQLMINSYLKTVSVEDFTKVKDFTHNYHESGLKTFLALEYGGQNIGDKIIEIGNRFDSAIAQKIFDKYAEIIDSVNNITDIAQNNFTSGISLHEQSLTDIETMLHKRGVMLLEKFHTQIDVDPNEIIAELDRINADTLTTLAIFKHAIKTGYKLPIEAISGSEFSEKSGDQCSPIEINEMETIYQNNWKHFENQELIQIVIKKFSNSFIGTEAKKQQIYTYKKDGKISAFVKFASLEAGVKYASALNVDEHVQGFGLGEAMMDEALHREAQHNILHAMCEVDKDSAMRYFEKGFISTGFSPDHPPFLQICWNETENKNIKSKQMTTEQLAIMYLKQDTGDILVKKSKTLTDLHASENFIDGKCLTRCFRDPVGTGDWYGVYETIPDIYQSTTKTA